MKCALVKKTRRGKKLAGRKYCREKPGSLQQSVSEIVVVENNYLSSKQIGAWSAEMKSCQASGGNCDGIIKKYEELSTSQQQQLIRDCAINPTT